MNPQGIYGAVVYQREIQIPTGEKMYLILYYPNEIHSDTHGNGGNPVMMSEIAGKNLLNGRWEQWFETTKSAMGEENDLVGHIDSIVDVMYSTEMKGLGETGTKPSRQRVRSSLLPYTSPRYGRQGRQCLMPRSCF